MIADVATDNIDYTRPPAGLSKEQAGTYKDRESVSKTNPDKQKIQLEISHYI